MNLNLEQNFNKSDLIVLIETIEQCDQAQTEEDIQNIIYHFGKVVPFDTSAATIVQVGDHQEITGIETVNNYDPEWLEKYMNEELYKQDPVAIQNFTPGTIGDVQYWDDTYKNQNNLDLPIEALKAREHFIKQTTDFEFLQSGFSCGDSTMDNPREISIFSITGSVKNQKRTRTALELIKKPIHYALTRWKRAKSKIESPLSAKEKEVMELTCKGLSQQEIADELDIAIATVKQRVARIFKHLGTNNMSQSVSQAHIHHLVRGW